ncbi:MAG: transposase [Bacteroidales bacterium]|nr:transposase [Bacteroidales bacterium]
MTGKHYSKENGRKNMRLQGYDYSRAGLYFLTVVVQNRLHLFGEIHRSGPAVPSKLFLNDAGNMIEKWYHEIENKFPDKRCHEMMVMPNHFHCIIENMESDAASRPNDESRPNDGSYPENDNPKYGIHNKRYGATIGDVMDWFKTMTTNEYIRGVKINNWRRFNGKLWQRNYYDHIIRNAIEYQRISEYIINNPAKWNDDKFYCE